MKPSTSDIIRAARALGGIQRGDWLFWIEHGGLGVHHREGTTQHTVRFVEFASEQDEYEAAEEFLRLTGGSE